MSQARTDFVVAPSRMAQTLEQVLIRERGARLPVEGTLLAMVHAGLDRLPLPGHGATLERWRALAAVSAHDLSLAKLYEGHTDALAILAELGSDAVDGATYGVWCAEPPGHALALLPAPDGKHRLTGRKQWCSGAASVSHALVSCTDIDGRRCLAAVALRQPGVRITTEGWHSVGMADSASVDVIFDNAEAIPVGGPEAYLTRPGFWHGGAGVAACWYGAARAIGKQLHAAARAQANAGTGHAQIDPYRLAHLGSVDVALQGAVQLLRAGAAAIDADPRADAAEIALRLRLGVEAAATTVLEHATRALGAGPLCRDAAFARLTADLPVFLRQSHAERDLAALGRILTKTEEPSWAI